MEYKFLPLSLEAKAADDGLFAGYGAVFGNIDSDKDLIVPGAFKRTMEKGSNVRLLWQHRRDEVIGKWVSMREDSNGLYMEGKFTKGVQKADEAYLLMKDGAIDGLSIGYDVPKDGFERKGDVRYLKHLNLHEVSVVTFPANDRARVSGVKAMDAIESMKSQSEAEDILRDVGFSRQAAMTFLSRHKAITQSDSGEGLKDDLAANVYRLANRFLVGR